MSIALANLAWVLPEVLMRSYSIFDIMGANIYTKTRKSSKIIKENLIG